MLPDYEMPPLHNNPTHLHIPATYSSRISQPHSACLCNRLKFLVLHSIKVQTHYQSTCTDLLDEGSVELEKENVDLYQMTREIVSRLALQAEKRRIQVEVVGEHVECFGIRQILDEMIYNICENAIKYNKENGKVNIWVGNTLNGKKVIVQDTGIGIPKEHQDRIFERFYRVDKSHSRETGGTGLGLSIVKHGALLHNAEIHVESEEGKGTKMELIFHC